jgi:hypothetical protein
MWLILVVELSFKRGQIILFSVLYKVIINKLSVGGDNFVSEMLIVEDFLDYRCE